MHWYWQDADLQYLQYFLFYAPTFEEVDGAYNFRVHASVRECVFPSVRSSRTVHARFFEISYMDSLWKNSWHTFFLSELSPFLELCPLKKSEWNLMHSIIYEPYILGFEILYMDSSWKNSRLVFFSYPIYLPFWSYAPMKRSEWNLVTKISQKVFELGSWSLVSW